MNVAEVIQTLNAAAVMPSDGILEAERQQLVAACKKLQGSVEPPLQKTLNLLMAPHIAIGLRLAIDMKLFDLKSPSTIDEMAAQTGAEPLLVARVVRMLNASSYFLESNSSPITYTPTASGAAYHSSSPLALGVIHFTTQMEVIASLPRYFAEKGYSSPADAYDCPFQFAHNTSLHAFEWLAQRPNLQQASNVVMGLAKGRGGQEWWEIFPVKEKLIVFSPNDVALVDVGGGLGQALVGLKENFPSMKGKMIVQDLPVVIESLKDGDLPKGIEGLGHNFFDPQPIKEARAYYLRAVLHDWPDKQALQILNSIKGAMGKDSLLLLNEQVVKEKGSSLMTAFMDINMMSAFGSLERNKAQWIDLLERAGFEVVKVWEQHSGKEGPSLIEARSKEIGF